MKISMLIIDDSRKMRQQVVDILRRSSLFETFYEASSGIEGLKIVIDEKPDLVLCDIEMPEMDGFKFLGALNKQGELQDIPVILLSIHGETNSKIRGLGLGASDYITKPFDEGEFLARIKVQLKIKSLQDRLRESNRLLLNLSYTDPLTGIYNRRQMMRTLEAELERSSRTGNPLSLILLDCDDFKRTNESYGHLKGDEVLRKLTEIFQRHLRQYDSVARFGGDEFALILPNTELSEAVRIAERVRGVVEQTRIDAGPVELQTTISGGIGHASREHVQLPEDLIREADHALFVAKRKGRNRIEVNMTGDRWERLGSGGQQHC